MRSIVKLFSSVKLAIVLIILITLASILGTLIPQGRSAAEYAARYGSLAGLFGSHEPKETLSRLGPGEVDGLCGLENARAQMMNRSRKGKTGTF